MILYYLVIPWLYLLSYLPTSFLLKIADAIAFLLRVVFRYRRSVVLQNLQNSFPEKTSKELDEIMQQFYVHLADRMVESIKTFTISAEEIDTRMSIPAAEETMNKLWNEQKSIIATLGHIGAWEWAALKASDAVKQKLFVLYNPIKNKYFNQLIKQTRGRFGLQLVSMNVTRNYFNTTSDPSIGYILVADQSPSNPRNAYWTTFLNQETAFFYGPARLAKKNNCAFYYIAITQPKRGHYQAELKLLAENANDFTEEELTEKFVRMLESQILANPSDWLWSHKRWKRKKPAVQ